MKSDNIKGFFDKENFGAWVTGHKRQVAVGCIAACLVIAAGGSVIGSSRNKSTEGQEGAVVTTSAAEDAAAAEEQAVEEANPLEQDAYPEVNELVQKYYEDMSTGDVEGLASVEDQISEEEQNRILRSRDLVEGYQNISCYTKKGLEENSYLVFVYYELKFAQIDTPAPGLSPLYVYTNDEGNLVIFNGEASDELNAYVQKVAQDDDVMALREEVKTKYEEAKATDENLAKQEERYLKIAQESAANEETAEEETSAEETNAEETTRRPRRRVQRKRRRRRLRQRVPAARRPRTVRPASRRACVFARRPAQTRSIWEPHIRASMSPRSRATTTVGARSATVARSATARRSSWSKQNRSKSE